MELLIGIDDTDDLESPGTGELAERIASMIAERGWGARGAITRHQLYVHPEIPYTSHNSAMCFPAEVADERRAALISAASRFLEENCAPGSDPGLCVASIESGDGREALVDFGRRAKVEVLDKVSAYALARRLGIHLSEHGGTGGGVIGALAGVGFRLGSEDGRFRGKMEFGSRGNSVCARELLEASGSESIRTVEGTELGEEERIEVGDFLKAVLLGGRKTILVERNKGGGPAWMTAAKETVKRY